MMHMHDTQNHAAIMQPHDQLLNLMGNYTTKLKINFLTILASLAKPSKHQRKWEHMIRAEEITGHIFDRRL